MKKETIAGANGRAIPCAHTLSGGEQTVVVVSHGFGSSKESSTGLMLAGELPKHGAGVFAYDFPAHGESPVDGSALTVKRCLDDLNAVTRHVRATLPGARVVYFGSSFGAYITLLYLSAHPGAGQRAFLRSAAVEMPLLLRTATAGQARELAEQGFLMFGAQFGYARPLKLTQAFFDELDAHDVFARWHSDMAELCMIHGDADQVAPYAAAQRFAAQAGARLVTVPGGDHQLSIPSAPQRVLDAAIDFLL